MKHILQFILVSLFLWGTASLSFGQKVKSVPFSTTGTMSDFRNSPWGVTKAQVKMTEHLELRTEDSTSLIYSGLVLGRETDVVRYKFYKGKLYAGFIQFAEGDNDGTSAISDFSDIKDAIASVFGKTDTQLHWSNAALEYSASAHEDQRGEAVSQGYLSMRCTWSSGSVMSQLSLSGGSNGIVLAFISLNFSLAPPKPSAEGEF